MRLSKLDTILSLIDEVSTIFKERPTGTIALAPKLNTPKTRNTLLGVGYVFTLLSPLLSRYKFLSWAIAACGIVTELFSWLLGGSPKMSNWEEETPAQLEFPFMAKA